MKRKYTRKLLTIKFRLGELLAEGMSVRVAAETLGVPRSTANLWRDELGLTKRGYRKSTASKHKNGL